MCAETLTGPYKDSVSAWIVACTDNSCADKTSKLWSALRTAWHVCKSKSPTSLYSLLFIHASVLLLLVSEAVLLIVRSFCYMLMGQLSAMLAEALLRMTAHASWQAIGCPKGH